MSELTTQVDEIIDALGSFDPAFWSGADCAHLAERFAVAGNALHAASARATIRAKECGQDRTTEFLAWVSGSTPSAARAAMETIEALQFAPDTDNALRAGEISIQQAEAIVSAPGEFEAELLELAKAKGLGPVRDLARKRRLEGMKPEDLHEKQVEAQQIRNWKSKLGNIGFQGELPPEFGVPFINRLDKLTDRLWRAATKEERKRPREWFAARAFVQLFSETGGGGKSGTPGFVIVCDLNAYRRGWADQGEVCHIIGGGPIPVGLAKELSKDGFLKAVLHDGTAIHTVAHFGRHRPAVLQTALDLGAPPEFEGVSCTDCGRHFRLQWDHVDPFVHGGLTSRDNLEPRCPECHEKKTARDRRAGLLRGPPKVNSP